MVLNGNVWPSTGSRLATSPAALSAARRSSCRRQSRPWSRGAGNRRWCHLVASHPRSARSPSPAALRHPSGAPASVLDLNLCRTLVQAAMHRRSLKPLPSAKARSSNALLVIGPDFAGPPSGLSWLYHSKGAALRPCYVTHAHHADRASISVHAVRRKAGTSCGTRNCTRCGPFAYFNCWLLLMARAADPIPAILQATSAAPSADAAGGAPEPAGYALQAGNAGS